MTENKFEKSRKGRGGYKILLANGKIAEVIFSTLLNNKRRSSNSSDRNIQQRFLLQMIRENANETIPINSFQQQAQMNLSNTYPETPSAHTLKTNKK